MEWTTNEIVAALDTAEYSGIGHNASRTLRTYLQAKEMSSGGINIIPEFTLLAKLQRLFIFNLPNAPNVYLAGGVLTNTSSLPVVSVTGTDFSSYKALIALAGEIAEALARDPINHLPPYSNTSAYSHPDIRSALQQYGKHLLCRLPHIENDGMLQAKPLANYDSASFQKPDYEDEGYPTVLCQAYSKQPDNMPPISEGCAAHRDRDIAIQSAIREKFERDAAAAWWIGGVPPRHVKPTLTEFFHNLIIRCGQKKSSTRYHKLLELTLDFGPPVFAAISSQSTGFGLAVGLGCSFSEEAAVKRAFLELKQMEFAQFLACKKRSEIGTENLNRAEIAALMRAEKLNVQNCSIFQTDRPVKYQESKQSQFSIVEFSRSALSNDIELFCIDMSSTDTGQFVVKVLSPNLLSPVLDFPQTKINQYHIQWGINEPTSVGVELM